MVELTRRLQESLPKLSSSAPHRATFTTSSNIAQQRRGKQGTEGTAERGEPSHSGLDCITTKFAG